MTQVEGYRARTLMVRQAARQHLLEVRRQRLAKHGLTGDPAVARQASEQPDTSLDNEIAVQANDLPTDMDLAAVDEVAAKEYDSDLAAPDFAESIEEANAAPVSDIGLPDDPAPPSPVAPPADSAPSDADWPDANEGSVLPALDPVSVMSADRSAPPAAKPVARKTRRPKKQKESVGAEEDNLSILAAAMQDIDDDQGLSNTWVAPPSAIISAPDVSRGPRPSAESIVPVSNTEDAVPAFEGGQTRQADADVDWQDVVADRADDSSHAADVTLAQKGTNAPATPDVAGGLETLPGAGPGLIWMLGQVGISSLEDLAQADADALSRKLGLVGQLLNVGSWVAYARTVQDSAGG